MSFLEALKEFIANGISSSDEAKIIIFSVVNRLLDDFISIKKFKNRRIPENRFEELKNITIDTLLKEGFKSIYKNAEDEEDAYERLEYLISQYYSGQYLLKNPHIQRLNDDVKELLCQFANYFPQVGGAKYIHHKIITITDDFEIEKFENYSFSQNEPRKSRLKKVFFAIFTVLNIKKSITYSDLIDELKLILGLHDNDEIPFPFENKKDLENKTDYNYIKHKVGNDIVSSEDSNFVPEDGDEKLDKKAGFEKEIILLPLISENEEIEDSNIIEQAINEFLSLCKERQLIIFGIFLLKEEAFLNEESAPDDEHKTKYKNIKTSLNDKFKNLTKLLDICQATLYNEKDEALKNLGHVYEILELNDQEKQFVIKQLINVFEDKFNINGN